MRQVDSQGTWFLSENENLLNYSSATLKIEEITPTKMVLASTMEGYSRVDTYIPCSK
jgi:hypothetical protein